MRPTAVDLFAGAGGLALGFEQAGFDVLASFDYDPVHCATHSFNFDMTEVVCADVRDVQMIDIELAARRGWERHYGGSLDFPTDIDVIIGGPPCQGFSLIGKRELEDARNSLVFHFLRLILDVNPRYFVMENVPGMLTGGHRSIATRLILEFERNGYRVVQPVKLLNASMYGVPQNRERVFLLGARADQALPHYPACTVRPPPLRSEAPTLFKPTTFETLPHGPTVGDAIDDLPDLDRFSELLENDAVELPEAELRQLEARASSYVRRLRGLLPDPNDLSYPRRWNPNLLTSSTRTRHTKVSVRRFEQTPPGVTEPVSRFYRLDPEGLCNTLRSGTGSDRGAFTSPRPIHPRLPRVLSVREAARLHSYPDWFRFHRTKWHGFRQIGNSVPPLLAREVGRQVVLALGVDPDVPTVKRNLGSEELLAYSMREAAEFYGACRDSIPQPRTRGAAT